MLIGGLCLTNLSSLLSKLPVRSVWVVGGDFNAEVGSRGVGEEEILGRFSHGRRTRSGHQLMEWTRGEDLLFCFIFHPTSLSGYSGFIPRSGLGRPIDHLLIRPRGHRFLGAAKVLHEEPLALAESWSSYTDHNPIEVRLAKGWVFRAVCRPVRKLKRPNWRLLRGVWGGGSDSTCCFVG